MVDSIEGEKANVHIRHSGLEAVKKVKRPIIGITMYRVRANWGAWRLVPVDLLPYDYAAAVEAAGGVPVLLPIYRDAEGAFEALALVDGLIIAGGPDVDPSWYCPGAKAGDGYEYDRDRSEFAMIAAAEERQLPVLGVCRGMQLMAVYGGGALLQDIPSTSGSIAHLPGPDSYGRTPIRTAPASILRGLVGESCWVRCHHHQAVLNCAEFVATAVAADGVVEGIELPDRKFWVGVQWHPEVDGSGSIFRGLVTVASGFKASGVAREDGDAEAASPRMNVMNRFGIGIRVEGSENAGVG